MKKKELGGDYEGKDMMEPSWQIMKADYEGKDMMEPSFLAERETSARGRHIFYMNVASFSH